MINGKLGYTLYWMAWLSVYVNIIVIGYLATGDHTIPDELTIALTSSFAFIAGSHVNPRSKSNG
jgi:hypothetical protein